MSCQWIRMNWELPFLKDEWIFGYIYVPPEAVIHYTSTIIVRPYLSPTCQCPPTTSLKITRGLYRASTKLRKPPRVPFTKFTKIRLNESPTAQTLSNPKLNHYARSVVMPSAKELYCLLILKHHNNLSVNQVKRTLKQKQERLGNSQLSNT